MAICKEATRVQGGKWTLEKGVSYVLVFRVTTHLGGDNRKKVTNFQIRWCVSSIVPVVSRKVCLLLIWLML
jgi:hypothetical protein